MSKAEQTKEGVIDKVSEDKLHISRAGGWLTSRFHFSFADWSGGPSHFGCLRVMNDDLVIAKKGFGLHPHRHMEIFSYVIEGYLSHGDSTGNSETLERGDIQHMSAGDGVWHKEMNEDKHHTCRFIQTWIVPDRKKYDDSKVRYGSISLQRADRLNQLAHVIEPLPTDEKSDATTAPIQFRNDCNVYVCELEKDRTVEFDLKEGRQAYLICIEGDLNITGNDEKKTEKLAMREAAKMVGPVKLGFKGVGAGDPKHFINQKRTVKDEKDPRGIDVYPSAHFMLIEMAYSAN